MNSFLRLLKIFPKSGSHVPKLQSECCSSNLPPGPFRALSLQVNLWVLKIHHHLNFQKTLLASQSTLVFEVNSYTPGNVDQDRSSVRRKHFATELHSRPSPMRLRIASQRNQHTAGGRELSEMTANVLGNTARQTGSQMLLCKACT